MGQSFGRMKFESEVLVRLNALHFVAVECEEEEFYKAWHLALEPNV